MAARHVLCNRMSRLATGGLDRWPSKQNPAYRPAQIIYKTCAAARQQAAFLLLPQIISMRLTHAFAESYSILRRYCICVAVNLTKMKE